MSVPPDIAAALALGGEMGKRLAAVDWERHPLGPIAQWPAAARALTATALTSRFPIVLWFGPELRLVYNDAYIPALGDKHPHALGEVASTVWWEIWDTIGPMLTGVVDTGVATWSHDQRLMLMRAGYREEAFFTFTYSPIVDADGSIYGVFCAVTETTERVIGTRRLATLHALASALTDAQSVDSAADLTVEVCEAHDADLPFVALYLDRPDVSAAPTLHRATSGVDAVLRAEAPSMRPWLDGADRSSEPYVVSRVVERFPKLAAALEPVPDTAVLLALDDPTAGTMGSLVVGVNPQREFDHEYRRFCELLAVQVAAAFGNARAHETERQRAESLAELDRAKIAFFSNVSHEFRTPLTLMLGPLDEALHDDDAPASVQHDRIATARRNGLRLLKLVNSLLDFSRIEAGGTQASLASTDLCALTAELVGVFRPAFDAAQLELHEHLGPLATPVAVDVDMYETIVFNLLSNALKYTESGAVHVTLGQDGDRVRLSVEDSGVGIAATELEHIFDRFYRSLDQEGRSTEGTGIGLALSQQLARLHGGDIEVASTPGTGSTFVVSLPVAGDAREPALRVGASTGVRAATYLAEVGQWLPEIPGSPAVAAGVDGEARTGRADLLVVDDNADMRRYLSRLLQEVGDVRLAANGRAALEEARARRPDAIVSDVMMPELDGSGLIAALRGDEHLARVPVLLLSARAGAEATLDGLAAGADDYMAKPFVARELVARMSALLAVGQRQAALDAREADRARAAAVIAEIATGSSAAVDMPQILDSVVDPLGHVGGLALAVLSVVERDEPVARQYFGGRDLPVDLRARYLRTPLDAATPHTTAMRTGQPLLFVNREDYLQRMEVTGPDAAQLGIEACAFMPLFDAAEVTGCLTIAWTVPIDFTGEHIIHLHDIADIVGRAVVRVQASEYEREIASRLQTNLLANEARPTNAVVRTRYLAAEAGVRVGGDWYDVIEIDDGHLAVAVGDVVGHGLDAASAMGQLRSALGVAALQTTDPAEAIRILDRFARHVRGAACATVAYAVIDTERETLAYASAGHPPPLLATPDGDVRLLQQGRSWPLQAVAGVERGASATVAFPAGSLLVLYTDGLVERRTESLDVGLGRLVAAVRDSWNLPLSRLEHDIVTRLVPGSSPAKDDIAIVAVRSLADCSSFFARTIPARTGALAELRDAVRAWLDARGLPPDARDDFVLALGEAVTNAIEHGGRRDERSVVEVELAVEDATIVATVRDTGTWQSGVDGFMAGRGRGHTMMQHLLDSVDVQNDHRGTVVTLRSRPAPISR